MPAPANNLFANRIVINPGALPYSLTGIDNTLGTEEVGDPLFIVQGDGTIAGAAAGFKHCWWEFTPTVSQNYEFLCSSTSPNFGIFTGGALGVLVEVASWAGRLTLYLDAGTTYQIAVISWNGAASPSYDVSLTATTTVPGQQLQTLREAPAFPISVDVDGSLLLDRAGPVGSSSEHVAGYKFTITEETYLSFWIHKGAGATTINPSVRVFSDTNWNIFDWPDLWPDLFNYVGVNYPVIVTFPPGTYYAIATYFNSPALAQNITIDIEKWTQPSEFAAGSILASDDFGVLPPAVIDPATGDFLGYVPGVASAEYAYTDAASGKTLLANVLGSIDYYPFDGDDQGFVLYDDAWAKAWSFNQGFSLDAPITGVGNGKFYVGNITTHPSATSRNVKRIDVATPALDGASWAVTVASGKDLYGMALSSDEQTLYYSCGLGLTAEKKVRRWDMGGNTGLSDLATSATHVPVREIVVMADGSVLVSWYKNDHTAFVRRYDASGSTLNTYNMFDAFTPEMRLWADADTANFWSWVKKEISPSSIPTVSVFRKIRASDGTILIERELPFFEQGLLASHESVTPAARFGHSLSCLGAITLATIALSEEPVEWEAPAHGHPSDPCCCDCPTNGGPIPSRTPTPGSTGPILPPVLAGDWTPFCAGGGVVPTAADTSDTENWVS